MLSLYNSVCSECSRLITNRYSTSFSLGIRLFDKKFREPIYNIYAFVRFADEIVDTFYHMDQKHLLQKFREETFNCISEKFSLNPVLNAFQQVVNKYDIDLHLIEAFLDSMEMDLYNAVYDKPLYNKYIYGSAEVVGLMCLKVFLEGDEVQYNILLPSACSLGRAFQKVNFLRDVKSDYQDRGRVYFPGIDFTSFDEMDMKAIEQEIEEDFRGCLRGLKELPRGVRLGVFTAYKYYLRLYNKIKEEGYRSVKGRRVRIANGEKLYIMTKTIIRNGINML